MTDNDEQSWQATHDRIQAKLERNARFLRRSDAMDEGNPVSYDDLTQVADVLSLQRELPTLDQLKEIQTLLLNQQAAIARLLTIIEPLIAEDNPQG